MNPELITCHYLKYFNVNIFANEMKRSYRWKNNNWYSIDTDEPLKKDQEITVEILDVNINSGNLSMSASIDRVLAKGGATAADGNSNNKRNRPLSLATIEDIAVSTSTFTINNDNNNRINNSSDNDDNDDPTQYQHYDKKKKKHHKSR